MVRCVSYGKNEQAWFVQTCCGEEHTGKDCDCVGLGENFTECEAMKLAYRKAEELSVPVEKW